MTNVNDTERPPLHRTHLSSEDKNWMPSSVRAMARLAAAILAATLFCILVAVVYGLGVASGRIWIGAILAGLGGIVSVSRALGDEIARSIIRGRTARLRGTAAPRSGGPERRDGELTRLVGRVRALTTISALTEDRPVVLRRMVFSFHGISAVHESAVDFFVEDESGEPVLILVSGARLLAKEADPKRYQTLAESVVEKLEALDPPESFRDYFNDWRIDLARGRNIAMGYEEVLRDGDRVEVMGSWCQTVDQTVTMRLERDMPLRAALRGNEKIPLIIALDDPAVVSESV